MNILVVAQYQGDGSPTASFIHDQVKAYVQLGHSVRVLAPVAFMKNCMGSRTMHGFKEIDGIQHYYLRHLSLSNLGQKTINTPCALLATRILRRMALKGFRPDVIHVHTLGLASELGAYLKSVLKCPLVVTTHGSDTVQPLENGLSDQLRRHADKVDTIVAVSTKLQDKLSSCATKTKLCAILNGFQIHRLDPQVRSPYGMIQVGNLIPSKRADITIRAFSELHHRYPEMTLTIVGQGPLRQELDTLCHDLNVSKAVTFMGQQPNNVVLQNMCGAAFFVMVSKPEGFGIVYLEAMAAGCITIGTEGEGISDLIVSGENGFLIPPDDPAAIVNVIQYCLNNPEEAAAIAQRGQQAVQGLTWEKNAKQYVELFEELIDSCKNC